MSLNFFSIAHRDRPPIHERVNVPRMAKHVPANSRAQVNHFIGRVPGLSKRDCEALADAVNDWLAAAPLRALNALPATGLPYRPEHR